MNVSNLKRGDESKQITTMGELLPNGDAIDQLRGGQLLLWHGDHAQIGPTAEHGGRIYAPAILDAHVEQVLHLPAGIEDFGRTEDLIADLRKAYTTYRELEERTALLLGMSSLASWVPECLPGPLLINPWGPPGTETALLDLMACVCRRPLRLAQPALHELARLPAGLAPTLILNRPGERALRQLFAAAGDPDTYFLSGGQVVHVHCHMVVYTPKPVMAVPALTIPLLPATQPLRRITNSEAQTLVDFFQPRLLHYRLTRHLKVANSQFDVAGLCPEVRVVARVLGAALEDSPTLQASMIEALSSLDEERKAEQSQTPAAAVVEALLLLSHAKRPVAYVGQVSELANTLLEDRDENMQLSPRAVGEILRQELGLVARRRPSGYELALDLNTLQRIHRLAVAHNVLQPVVDCPLCAEVSVSIPTENQSVPGA
jgi:hypothetical protein